MNRSDFDHTVFVLDFDRCIGDTDKARDILWAVIESKTTITASELYAVKNTMDKKGYAYDTVEYAAKELLRQKSTAMWPDSETPPASRWLDE